MKLPANISRSGVFWGALLCLVYLLALGTVALVGGHEYSLSFMILIAVQSPGFIFYKVFDLLLPLPTEAPGGPPIVMLIGMNFLIYFGVGYGMCKLVLMIKNLLKSKRKVTSSSLIEK